MNDSADYKILDRKKFAAAMVIPLGLVAVGVWVSLDWFAQYLEGLAALAEDEPQRVAATVKQLTRALAVVNGIVLFSFSALIIWHGRRGLRTAAMPPKGSWILEGQRTWAGEPALRIARFTIAVGAMLAVIGIPSTWLLWRLGDTLLGSGA